MRAALVDEIGYVAVLLKHASCSEVSCRLFLARLVIVELPHSTGQALRVVCGHMHHKAEEHPRQWADVANALAALSSVCTIFLMHHNGLIVPEADSVQSGEWSAAVR